ncbi:MAG: CCA tRNA nucleotidyltransferase [Janthinobacterium lividum]
MQASPPPDTEAVLQTLRDVTRGTEYEGRLFLVGGFVRDKAVGQPSGKDDIDIVLEGNALDLARFLREQGVADHEPVVYPKFGTAMVAVRGRDVELVTARIESYAPDSRKPETVEAGTLSDDARRRDFTINTLMENLQTGEITDPLGKAFADIDAQIIRTPTDPRLTFQDDPLRMLRAVRFAARFGFTIEPFTWKAIRQSAPRLSIISAERIRDEFCKMLLTTRAPLGLELLKGSGLLAQFAPELMAMVGVTQNEFHAYPVWDHTVIAVGNLPPDASLPLRLATLCHDIGKPPTKATGDDGKVHFYGHQDVGAEMTRKLMNRLKFSNDEIAAVTKLVALHMRIGEYKPVWTDAAVRRLMRDLGPQMDDLFTIHRVDVSALGPGHTDISRADELRTRMAPIQATQDINTLTSPLDGQELMALLKLPPGKRIGEIKEYLTNEVVEGRLAPDDKAGAERLARSFRA